MQAAQWNLQGGFHNTVCFLAQQATEKALKSLVYFSGTSRKRLLTHSVFELLMVCKKVVPCLESLVDEARELDIHYIPSRYPNGLVSGFPHQFYGKTTAERALVAANAIVDAVEKHFSAKGFVVPSDRDGKAGGAE